MNTHKRASTTEMQVTSIRLETELKDRLREISGAQGYQALIRDVLWQFVEQQTIPDMVPVSLRSPLTTFDLPLSREDIRATFDAVAQQVERCAITGQAIQPQQAMWLGLTNQGILVPLAILPR